MKSSEIKDNVSEYYGETLQSNADLKTSACCLADTVPDYHKAILSKIEDEILAKFYGCGSPIPSALQGMTVLDLGCGTGRDVYLASALVGAQGHVIGVDMTAEQLDVARRYEDAQMKRFGFSKSNVSFKMGCIEDLASLGIEDSSVDVVISNCVLNLSPEKEKMFAEIFRVLKPGGELYFSDVFAAQRIPQDLQEDPLLRGECLSGAMYVEDFRRMLLKMGCPDYRIVAQSELLIEDAAVKSKIGMIDFISMTVRAFKIKSLEDRCEDFGQVATYLGGIEHCEHEFVLDDHHVFEKGRPMLVCGNTAEMLQETRFQNYFKIDGDHSRHFGLFGCEPENGSTGDSSPSGACC